MNVGKIGDLQANLCLSYTLRVVIDSKQQSYAPIPLNSCYSFKFTRFHWILWISGWVAGNLNNSINCECHSQYTVRRLASSLVAIARVLSSDNFLSLDEKSWLFTGMVSQKRPKSGLSNENHSISIECPTKFRVKKTWNFFQQFCPQDTLPS
jgi:hypothetical protein